MKPSALDDLKAVRSLISEPNHWCKGNSAIDENGDPVSATSDRAVAWCLVGAIERVGNGQLPRVLVMSVLLNTTGYGPCEIFNDADDTTHDDVLRLIDKAITNHE